MNLAADGGGSSEQSLDDVWFAGGDAGNRVPHFIDSARDRRYNHGTAGRLAHRKGKHLDVAD